MTTVRRILLSYIPTPGKNIDKIYQLIPLGKKITNSELIKILAKKHPDIPINSLHNHTKFLAVKNLIERVKKDGEFCYRRLVNGKSKLAALESYPTRSICALNLLQDHIGKRITGKMILEHCYDNKKQGTPYDLLAKLSMAGYLQFIEHTRPKQYLVLPEIKTLDHIPNNLKPVKLNVSKQEEEIVERDNAEVMKPNFTDMSLGEILDDYMGLKQENQRMKDSLQRIANELFQLIEK